MRARWVKPEFFKDKKVASMGPVTALVYQALWCMADDGGTAPADPEVIKGEMFTWWSAVGVPEITGALRALFEAGRIRFHRASDEWFCSIRNFQKHQAVHKPSKFRYALDRNGFRDATPAWCGTGEEPPPEDTGTPHILDSQTPRLPSSSPPERARAETPEVKQCQRMLARFDFDDRLFVEDDYLALIPEDRRFAWVALLDAWTENRDIPPTPKLTAPDIAAGLRAYLADCPVAKRTFNPKHVLGYCRDVARKRLDPPEPAKRPTNGSAPADSTALDEFRAVLKAIGEAGGVRNLPREVYEGLSPGGKAAWREVGGASALANMSERERPFMERRWCQAYRSAA